MLILFLFYFFAGQSRQNQYNIITSEVRKGIADNQGLTIYCVGIPGTGKTMVVGKALGEIKKQYTSKELFRSAYVQGTAVDSQLLYFNIAAQLDIIPDDIDNSSSSCYRKIKDRVLTILGATKTRSKKPLPMTLLFIDEIDQAPFDEVRTLINMTGFENSKLIVIGTGNNASLIPELSLLFDPNVLIFHEFTKVIFI